MTHTRPHTTRQWPRGSKPRAGTRKQSRSQSVVAESGRPEPSAPMLRSARRRCPSARDEAVRWVQAVRKRATTT
eukprot:7232172-Prymnesium_polylepis.1